MVHFPDAAGLAAATGDLRQTGYSRLHGGAQDVVRDQVHEGPIELLHVRPGADHGHITEQDINELRDLVQICPAQQGADSRDTRAVLVGLTAVGIRLVNHHAELHARNDLPTPTDTLLPAKYLAALLHPAGDRHG